jgi:hypothetical protein
MKIDAECAWGDGPDVLLTIDDKLYDLTIDEAFNLASRLTMAAQYARYHESMLPYGFDPLI